MERVGRVADRVVAAREAGHDVVVVVSAMGKTTDGLLALAATHLPVAIDGGAGDIGPRMLGWCIAAAVCIPAVLVIWPLPWRSDFRVALAASARTLAATARAAAAGEVDEETAEATRRSVV